LPASNYYDNYTKIVDVQGETVFDAVVPFMWAAQFAEGAIGTIRVYVETPISEISNDMDAPITILVYTGGQDDLELRDPTGFMLLPQSSIQQAEGESQPFADFAQAGEPLMMSARAVKVADGQNTDVITHITQLTHRPCQWITSCLDLAYAARLTLGAQFDGNPKWTYHTEADSNFILFNGVDWYEGYGYWFLPGSSRGIPRLLDHFASSYLFWRGGSRVKMLSKVGSAASGGPASSGRIMAVPVHPSRTAYVARAGRRGGVPPTLSGSSATHSGRTRTTSTVSLTLRIA